MEILAILLVVMLIVTLAMNATGRWGRMAWELVVTLALVLLLVGSL